MMVGNKYCERETMHSLMDGAKTVVSKIMSELARGGFSANGDSSLSDAVASQPMRMRVYFRASGGVRSRVYT